MSHDSQHRFIDTGSHLKFQPGPVVLTDQLEMRRQLLGIIRSATRQVNIWSADIQSGLFEHPGFIEVLKRFVLAVRQARVRIMLSELPTQTETRHPLLLLAEMLPSTFEIRTQSADLIDAAELIVADETAILYRIHRDRWDGLADIHDPHVAGFYLGKFTHCWRNALPISTSAQVVEV